MHTFKVILGSLGVFLILLFSPKLIVAMVRYGEVEDSTVFNIFAISIGGALIWASLNA